MDSFEAIISRSTLFQGLATEDIGRLVAICLEVKLARGQLLFAEGMTASGFYLVAEGQVRIYKSNPQGREKILHVCGIGETFAEVPVFHGQPYPASAAAIQATRLLCFPRDKFASIITDYPSLSLNMLANFAMKLRRFSSQIEDLALREVPARIASHLLYLAQVQERKDQVALRIPKGQLANLLGTSPETLSRVFSRMAERGMIQIKGKQVYLLDLEALRDAAG